MVDIICNEETTIADGDQDEPVLVKCRSKNRIYQGENIPLSISCRLNNLETLQGEDMKSGVPKGLNACGYSVTIKGAKDVLKAKSDLKALKTSPWVNTLARRSKSSRQLKQKFSHTRKTPKIEAVDN